MPFNGSGTFNRVYDWTDDRDADVKILASRMDEEMDGFATGLTNCMTLDGQSTPTANLGMGGYKLTNLGTPTADADAATKEYVDDAATPSPRQVVQWATTANIDLSSDLENADTIDGNALTTGDIVLVKDQTNAAQNGIYQVVASGAASRIAAFDTWDEHLGLLVAVEGGTANEDTLWACMASVGGTLNTTDIVFAPSGSSITLPLGIGSGGLGVALTDPDADRLLGWDESAGSGGQMAFFSAGTGLGFSGTSLQVSLNYAQLDVEDQVITGGARVTPKDLGTPAASSTLTIDPGDRPMQYLDNANNFTLAPGSNYGTCVIDIVNNASGGGTVTTSGFDKVAGDSIGTTANNVYRCFYSNTANGSLLVIQAMQ